VGICTWIGLAVVLLGLALVAKAGMQKDREQALTAEQEGERRPINADPEAELLGTKQGTSFVTGLLICIVSGVFSPCLGLAMAFGENIKNAAKDKGASDALAGNAVWPPAVTCGFIVNLAYCTYLLQKNGTWSNFFQGTWTLRFKNAALGASMGGIWYYGNFMYGLGLSVVGDDDIASVIGWPVFMVGMVSMANISGFCFGEWNGVSASTLKLLVAGLATLLVATIIIAMGKPLYNLQHPANTTSNTHNDTDSTATRLAAW